MQLKLREIFIKIISFPNEIKMRRICTLNISCGSGEMVRGEFGTMEQLFTSRHSHLILKDAWDDDGTNVCVIAKNARDKCCQLSAMVARCSCANSDCLMPRRPTHLRQLFSAIRYSHLQV